MLSSIPCPLAAHFLSPLCLVLPHCTPAYHIAVLGIVCARRTDSSGDCSVLANSATSSAQNSYILRVRNSYYTAWVRYRSYMLCIVVRTRAGGKPSGTLMSPHKPGTALPPQVRCRSRSSCNSGVVAVHGKPKQTATKLHWAPTQRTRSSRNPKRKSLPKNHNATTTPCTKNAA